MILTTIQQTQNGEILALKEKTESLNEMLDLIKTYIVQLNQNKALLITTDKTKLEVLNIDEEIDLDDNASVLQAMKVEHMVQ